MIPTRVHLPVAVLVLGVVFATSTSAQELQLLVHGGYASYGDVDLSLGASPFRGGGTRSWAAGSILGLGVRTQVSEAFFLSGTVEYSHHPYDGSGLTDNPSNRILDLTGLMRATFRILGPLSGAFSFGAGYWNQTVDAVVYPAPNPVTWPGVSGSGLGLLLGLGLAVELSERIELDLDGNVRFRTFGTSVLQLGVAYRLD